MATRAEPTPDGQAFILNGEKLWCTNGVKAEVIVVMARTPPKEGQNQITAFILEMNTPGVTVAHRCRFMGLRALYNGVIRFENVRVPRANILLAEGKGLRVALTTLDMGRLTLPAACVGLAKRCLAISRDWATERVQWGAPIGQHSAIADKIARMAAETFAMEAMTWFTASLADRDQNADIRIEAAMCKMWATERAWEIVNDAVQIRGGRGEPPVPVERFLRDTRINTILEGSSEIIRLFIAREALDPHLKIAGPLLTGRWGRAWPAAGFYAGWYPRLWWPVGGYGARTARRLARSLFHSMLRFGPKLDRQQMLLGRYVEIATELFAMTALQARAESLATAEAKALADYFAELARLKIEVLLAGVQENADWAGYRVAQAVLAGRYGWLATGIVSSTALASARTGTAR